MHKIHEIHSYIERQIKTHKDTYDKENLRDLVDLYLKQEEDGFTKVPTLSGTVEHQSSYLKIT